LNVIMQTFQKETPGFLSMLYIPKLIDPLFRFN
jgi:hypothetical protein